MITYRLCISHSNLKISGVPFTPIYENAVTLYKIHYDPVVYTTDDDPTGVYKFPFELALDNPIVGYPDIDLPLMSADGVVYTVCCAVVAVGTIVSTRWLGDTQTSHFLTVTPLSS